MSMQNPYASCQKQAHLMKSFVPARQVPQHNQGVKAGTQPTAPWPGSRQMQQEGNNYLTNAIMTAPPEQLTLLLYQGAIKFIKQAIMQIEAKNIPEANRLNQRAQAVFKELRGSLDKSYEISHRLSSIYGFIIEGLAEANIKKDTELLHKMLEFATDLKNTWQEAIALAKQ